jgi:GTPase involved in cell partitioning and DNA repair
MDGHAGKDVLVKVPCGTLVWKLPSTPEQVELVEKEERYRTLVEQLPAITYLDHGTSRRRGLRPELKL